MKRLTMNNPRSYAQRMNNMVFEEGKWQHIRFGMDEKASMPTTDFCLMLCKERKCEVLPVSFRDEEEKDQHLCDCFFYSCPIATVYVALSGFGHVRGRLMRFEDEKEKRERDEYLSEVTPD